MREFNFDPTNEGEIAAYTLAFIPTSDIPAGLQLLIRFPDTFDPRLGRDATVSVDSGLTGDIKTSLGDRLVKVTGFDTYRVSSGSLIRIVVSGVVNPNKPETGYSGYVSVGSIQPNSNVFLHYLAQAGSVQTTPAAGWLTLNNISSSNLYSRTLADYSFNLTLTQKIGKSDYGGKVFVDLPGDFELSDGALRCNNLSANLGSVIKCVQSKRLIRVNGQPSELIGDVAFVVRSIKNPLDEVLTKSFFVRTYDGLTGNIVQRSFENLDPFKLNFSYPGPLIIVNDNQPIYCERGTQTKDLFLVVTEIVALNLTFVPVTPGFTFVPPELKITIGHVKIPFRVSVPMGFSEGEYTVEWVTKGDFDSPIYTPIKKTTVIITGKGSRHR